MSKKTSQSASAIVFDRTLSLRQLEFLSGIIDTTDERPVFRYAHTVYTHGATWLLSSDRHREHWLKVSKKEVKAFAIDLHRLISEIRLAGCTCFTATSEGAFACSRSGEPINVLGEKTTIQGEWVIDQARLGHIPVFEKVLPTWDDVREQNVNGCAFNFRYLSQACLLTDESRVYLNSPAAGKASVFCELQGDWWAQEWFAAIMPMSIEKVAS